MKDLDLKLEEVLKDLDTCEKKTLPTEEDQLKWMNDTEGDLNLDDGIDCEVCKNKGYYYTSINQAKKCKCMTKRLCYKTLMRNGFEELLGKKLKDYIVESTWQEKVKQTAIEYMEKSDKEWFAIVGQSGSGKTLICSIIANHYYDKLQEIMFITWTDFASKIKRTMFSTDKDKLKIVDNMVNELKTTDIVFIDELVKDSTPNELRYLVEIINYRYNNKLKTIITSEKLLNELLQIDEATFGRIVERCGKYFLQINYDVTRNYRLKKLQTI